MELLKGKRALITGGTSGLGRAIVKAYIENGAEVVFFGTNEGRGAEVAGESGGKAQFMQVNVADTAEVRGAIDQVLKEWAGVDIVINCAGITRDKLFMKMSEEDWDTVMDVNLKSVYNVCQPLIRPMIKARSGKIINITSVVALTGNPGQVNYSASKSGMIGFSRSLAKEVAGRNICVNCIAPGFFGSPMTDALSAEQKKSILSGVPAGRLGDPKELADAALFLGSEMSSYMTGQVLIVDGGMTA